MKNLIEIRNNLNNMMFKNFIINNEPKFLYHYTSLDSAKSIIESGQFWVSDAFTTTDDKEIIHVKDIINTIITEKYSFLENEKMKLCSDLFQHVCDIIKTNAFILCFSLVKDSKSLWGESTKKKDKIRVCLRFNFNKISPNLVSELHSQERYFVENNGKITKIQLKILNHFVTYNNRMKYKKIEEYMNLVYSVLVRIPFNTINFDIYKKELELLSDIFTDIFLFSCFSKVSKLKNEREYRMLYIFPDILKFPLILSNRILKTKIVKYVTTNMKANNTFSLNRIFVRREIKEVKKELKPYIGIDIKIKPI